MMSISVSLKTFKVSSAPCVNVTGTDGLLADARGDKVKLVKVWLHSKNVVPFVPISMDADVIDMGSIGTALRTLDHRSL